MESMTDEKILEQVQALAYEALEAVQKICKQNHITFYLRGGSVLGAVKYQGIVPWDDDIDLAIPRVEYQKLIQVMPKELNKKFWFVCYQKTKNVHSCCPKILVKKEYCHKLQIPCNHEWGLALLDILPLDGMPDGWFALKWHIIKTYFYRMLAGVWTLEVKDTVCLHHGWKKKVLTLLQKMKIHHLYKQDAIYHRLDRMYERNLFGQTAQSGTLMSSKFEKEIIPTSWWAQGEEMEFGPLRVKVPKNYDGYLKQVFGKNWADYEPPAEKRKKSHLTGYGTK